MHFVLVLVTGITVFLSALIVKRKTKISKPEAERIITPDSSIITFDIHGVLFTADWPKIARIIWANKKICTIGIYFLNPRFIVDLVKLSKKGAVLEACITYLSSKYFYFARHEKLIFLIANTQKPILPILALVQYLAAQGYTLHIFSDIGSSLYKNLTLQFPSVFVYFHEAFTPNGFNRKSHKKTFLQYLKKFNPHDKQIVLVDNNKNNITMAKETGIISIYYENPSQLRTTFKELRIL